MIPGMFPAGAAATGLSSIRVVNTVQSNNTSSSLSITIPTVLDGDLLVLRSYGWRDTGGDATITAVSGWTTITTASNFAASAASLHYVVATASMSGTTVSGGAQSGGGTSPYNAKTLLVIRGNAVIASASAASVGTQWTSSDPTAQSVSLSGALGPLIVLGSYSTVGASPSVNPRTFTVSGVDAKDSELQAAAHSLNDVWLAWKVFAANDNFATPVVVDMEDEGAAMTLMSCYLQCAA